MVGSNSSIRYNLTTVSKRHKVKSQKTTSIANSSCKKIKLSKDSSDETTPTKVNYHTMEKS